MDKDFLIVLKNSVSSGIHNNWLRLLQLIIAGLSFVYILQSFSLLRLNTDAVIFLSLADSFVKGHGLVYHGLPTHFPPGYPVLIALLDFCRFCNSSGLILLNIAFFAAGNIVLYYISLNLFCFKKADSFIIIIITLLSYIFIKHITLPLSDIVFYGFSMTAIGVFSLIENKENRHRLILIIIGIILTGLAIITRTIGLAIIIALVLYLVNNKFIKNRYFFNISKAHIILAIISAVTTILLLSILITNTMYFNEALQKYNKGGGILKGILWLWEVRIKELGELGINFPIHKFPSDIRIVFPLFGLIILGTVIYAIFHRINNYRFVDYYIVTYVFILLFWPYADARFWLPITPLMICLIGNTIGKISHENIRKAFTVYLLIFMIIGFGELYHSTRITFAGNRFPEYYGDDERLRETYRTFLSLNNTKRKDCIYNECLYLLKRYNNTK